MIGRKKKEPAAHPVTLKAWRRMDAIPKAEVLTWADNAGSGISRALGDYASREGRPEDLEDAYQGALMLLGCLESLRERDQYNAGARILG